jgi:hypothetical protein
MQIFKQFFRCWLFAAMLVPEGVADNSRTGCLLTAKISGVISLVHLSAIPAEISLDSFFKQNFIFKKTSLAWSGWTPRRKVE